MIIELLNDYTTVSITLPSPLNLSIILLLSKQNRALDRIEGDGNCLLEQSQRSSLVMRYTTKT